jgi:hypothetical protein
MTDCESQSHRKSCNGSEQTRTHFTFLFMTEHGLSDPTAFLCGQSPVMSISRSGVATHTFGGGLSRSFSIFVWSMTIGYEAQTKSRQEGKELPDEG